MSSAAPYSHIAREASGSKRWPAPKRDWQVGRASVERCSYPTEPPEDLEVNDQPDPDGRDSGVPVEGEGSVIQRRWPAPR